MKSTVIPSTFFPLIALVAAFYWPNTALALNCTQALASPLSSRPLTSAYISTNEQFPLFPELLSLSLAAKIVVNNISPNATYNTEHVLKALNNIHEKYNVPIRVDIGQPKQDGLRYITQERALNITDPVIGKSFIELNQLGLIGNTPSPREMLFWTQILKTFNSPSAVRISSAYKAGIMASHGNPDAYGVINSLKESAKIQIMDLIHKDLQLNLPEGLNPEERSLMNTSQLF